MVFIPDDLDYSRIDVNAMLEGRGIAVVEDLRRIVCERWLTRHGYELTHVDFGRPFKEVLAQFGAMFDWVGQFGYRFEDGDGNLDALNDGFSFPFRQERGQVLVVSNPEALAKEDGSWFDTILEIASDHSLLHLACGSRFFMLLVAAKQSPLVGRTYSRSVVPGSRWNLDAHEHEFVE